MIKRLTMAIAVLCFCAAMFVSSTGLVRAAANNGTLKVHEFGTASGTESNDPKVCIFNFEGFGFDAGQEGYININVQGGSSPVGQNAGPFSFGPADAQGFYATGYFNGSGNPVITNGTYKATLYGKSTNGGINLEDEKAKSKVFKVECAPGQGGENPPPVTTTTPPTGGQGGSVLGATSTAGVAATPAGGVNAGVGGVSTLSIGALIGLTASVGSLGLGVRRLSKSDL